MPIPTTPAITTPTPASTAAASLASLNDQISALPPESQIIIATLIDAFSAISANNPLALVAMAHVATKAIADSSAT